MLEAAPTKQAEVWLAKFAAALDAGDVAAAIALFVDDCYWRDLLAFTWNIKTAEGRDAVRAMLAATLAAAAPTAWTLSGQAVSNDKSVEAWFAFETAVARCEGMMRLRDGRARTLFTAMTELKGFEEREGPTRPLGVAHGATRDRVTWTDRRRREEAALGVTEQPWCVVIGGGQGGIALGARLKQLGVPTIILEKNARAGDSWRNRYRTLVLHDPVWYDHLPYLPFPDHWPVFTPKDKMGDWLEMYTRVMELNYWTSSTCARASFDEVEKIWTVVVDRDGEKIVLKPKQLVFATGAYGPPRMTPLPGEAGFCGEIIHSSQYVDGDRYAGKRVAVIGAASSAHDIAVDLWESGAEVIMIQRSPTTVVRSGTLMELGFDIYSEAALAAGITVDRADMIGASMPYALLPDGQKPLYDHIRQKDADFYAALVKAGFAIDFGEDETGQMMKAWRTGSGYYIDVGASQLIIDGEIEVKSGVSVERLTPTGLVLGDGSEIAADAVIACTGFQSMHETVARIVSREAADAVGRCWGLGSGTKGDPGPWAGDPLNMWKPTAHPALWFHGGNLALSRFYSKFLAIQIKARMEGIPTPVYGQPTPQTQRRGKMGSIFWPRKNS